MHCIEESEEEHGLGEGCQLSNVVFSFSGGRLYKADQPILEIFGEIHLRRRWRLLQSTDSIPNTGKPDLLVGCSW